MRFLASQYSHLTAPGSSAVLKKADITVGGSKCSFMHWRIMHLKHGFWNMTTWLNTSSFLHYHSPTRHLMCLSHCKAQITRFNNTEATKSQKINSVYFELVPQTVDCQWIYQLEVKTHQSKDPHYNNKKEHNGYFTTTVKFKSWTDYKHMSGITYKQECFQFLFFFSKSRSCKVNKTNNDLILSVHAAH